MLSKSKRLRLTWFALACNFILFGIGIIKSADLTSLGSGLAMLNAPLYAYIWGESIRPSKAKDKVEE